jgi:pimeloyl-ACP methyl ester carboxylesterase
MQTEVGYNAIDLNRQERRIMMYVVWGFLILVGGLLLYVLRGGPKLPPETDAIIDEVMNSELPEFVSGQAGFATSDGLQIWYESISPQSPPKGTVLLLMGQAGDALFWPPGFLRMFVDAGYRVIRYDHRGTGMSDWIEGWSRKNPYSIADMAGDAVAVLDAVNVEKAHLVGLSMGGMIAQEVAIHHPERVASLTLIITSSYIGDPDLPGMSSRFFFSFAIKGLTFIKYRTLGGERNLIKERIAKTIETTGYDGLDIKEIAELVLYDLRKRRGINIKAILQHQTAVTISGSRYDKLARLDVPALVIHGTEDQLIPVEHGKKLAEIIPGAEGLWLEGGGHVFPLPEKTGVNQTIIAHLNRTSDSRPSFSV